MLDIEDGLRTTAVGLSSPPGSNSKTNVVHQQRLICVGKALVFPHCWTKTFNIYIYIFIFIFIYFYIILYIYYIIIYIYILYIIISIYLYIRRPLPTAGGARQRRDDQQQASTRAKQEVRSKSEGSQDKTEERRRHGSSRRKKQKQERRGPQAGRQPRQLVCFGLAKAPFVSLGGWKTAETDSVLVSRSKSEGARRLEDSRDS